MKQVSDLKLGHKIYDVKNTLIVKYYTYVGVYPLFNNTMHSLFDEVLSVPITISTKELESILNQNLNQYRAAELALIEELEKQIKELRKDKFITSLN